MNGAPTPPPALVRRGSLARRLVVTASLWAAALLVIAALALTGLFRQTVMADLDDRLAGVSQALIATAEVTGAGGLAVDRERLDPRFEQVFSGRYWQIDAAAPDGTTRTLARSRSLWDDGLSPSPRAVRDALAVPGEPVPAAASGPDGEPLRLLIRAVSLPGLEQPVVVTAAEDRRPADREVARFALVTAGLFAGFAVLLAAGVLAQARIGLAPVFAMRRQVSDVRDGAADRLHGRYPGELLPLAQELNALLDHSEAVVERARTHTGNLAHALRTPLTVLANEAREGEGPLAELVRRQAAAMEAQVEHHLRRARAAANAQALASRTEVAPALAGLARTLERIHAERGVGIDLDVPADLVFRGERQDLDDLAGNLLDNACKWATARVRAVASPDADDPGWWTLSVEDDGPGLAAEARERVLARGVRLDERAPGSGLGLAIVADLARAYGGALHLGVSPLGGLSARIRLPRAKTSPETRR